MSEPLLIIDFTPVDAEITRQRQRADRAERILAALREPSEAVVSIIFDATFGDSPAFEDQCRDAARCAIRTAAEAAERAVDG